MALGVYLFVVRSESCLLGSTGVSVKIKIIIVVKT
jgi:hypothetical protein